MTGSASSQRWTGMPAAAGASPGGVGALAQRFGVSPGGAQAGGSLGWACCAMTLNRCGRLLLLNLIRLKSSAPHLTVAWPRPFFYGPSRTRLASSRREAYQPSGEKKNRGM